MPEGGVEIVEVKEMLKVSGVVEGTSGGVSAGAGGVGSAQEWFGSAYCGWWWLWGV